MDQHLHEQGPIATSASGFVAAAEQVTESMARPMGPLAGLEPMSQLSAVLASTIGGEAIDASRISDPEFMLPILMWDVERLHQTAFGESAGVEFLTDSDARYGVRTTVPQWNMRCASLVVMSLEPLCVAMERYDGRLDYLVDQFFADYGRGHIPFAASSPSTSIDTSRVQAPAGAGPDAQGPIP
jgi:hypothetical protein